MDSRHGYRTITDIEARALLRHFPIASELRPVLEKGLGVKKS